MNRISSIKSAITTLQAQEVFSFLSELITEIPEAEVYLVGGAVRDMILGRETKDYDFVIRNVSHQVISDFLSPRGNVDYVGRVFGVFKFYPHHLPHDMEAIDITLPRTEHTITHTGAYKDFAVQTNPSLPIEIDLSRRDFTINAIAINWKTGEIVDPYHGSTDLEQRMIKTVGAPDERLQEDYSRILRGLRFACQLDFTIEPATFKTIKKLITAGALTSQQKTTWIVPRETIGKELVKAFYANPVRAFDLYEQTGAFEQLLPEVVAMRGCPQPLPWHGEGDVYAHTKLALQHAAGSSLWQKYFNTKKPNALSVIAILLHDIGKPICLKTPEHDGVDRIRFDEHEPEGARMAHAICERLALSVMPTGTALHINPDHLTWIIGHHLLLLHTNANDMRSTTIEKYFFSDKPGQELLELLLCDGAASVNAETHEPGINQITLMIQRVRDMAKLKAERDALPPPLLDGNEVMALLHMPPGPEVGTLLQNLRELQLQGTVTTKEEARVAIIKKRDL